MMTPICYFVAHRGQSEIAADIFFENFKLATAAAHKVGGGAIVVNPTFLAKLGATIQIVERDTVKNRGGNRVRKEFDLPVNKGEPRVFQTLHSVTFNGRPLRRGV